MRKVVAHRPGSYHRLRIERQPEPVPEYGAVTIDVQAAGVNFAGCITRMGLYASANDLAGDGTCL